MSDNTIRARLEFSFKGETHTLDSVIDLDRCLGESEDVPDFHLLLAKAAGIDPYSYVYEVLASHEIEFSDAAGAAVQACRESGFDWDRFVQARREGLDWEQVQAVATPFLKGRDLEGDVSLKVALLAVYRAGKRSNSA